MDNIKGYVQQIHSEFYKKLLPKVKNESRQLVVWNLNSTFLIDFLPNMSLYIGQL